MSLNIRHSRDWAIAFTATHKQPFPLRHYCGIISLLSVASGAQLMWLDPKYLMK